LEGVEFAILFLEFRWRSGICTQERFSNAFSAVFSIPASARTEPWTSPCMMLDTLAARIAGKNA